MLNPATHHQRDVLNEFTSVIVAVQNYGATTKVRLRCGHIVEPIYKLAEDEHCEDCFSAKGANGYWYYWHLDGTSLARHDYDMMEIVY